VQLGGRGCGGWVEDAICCNCLHNDGGTGPPLLLGLHAAAAVRRLYDGQVEGFVEGSFCGGPLLIGGKVNMT
jgi:hypothetical protein